MNQLYKEFQSDSEYFHDNIPFIMEGLVVNTADPDQDGRLQVWVPSLDGEDYDINQLPWCSYASPFIGFTVDYPAGENSIQNLSHAAYGMWMIPKMGATVVLFCLNGNPSSRYYFACTGRLHRNRSLPAGRNVDGLGNQGPWGDAGDGSGKLNPIQPAYDNLRTQFNNNVTASEAITRGAYERQVAQAQDNKDGNEGYAPNPNDASYLDPQTYCITTPGRHAIIMQDDPTYSRLRFKTAEGHQIIFDDANERIYISTSKGQSWIEMDQDGHVNIFGGQSLSMRAGGDINMYADNNINMEAGNGVNIKADGEDIRLSSGGSVQVQATKEVNIGACQDININGEADVYVTSGGVLDLSSGSDLSLFGTNNIEILGTNALNLTGQQIVNVLGVSVVISGVNLSLNESPAASATQADTASCPEVANSPSIVPNFEPWVRPVSGVARGAYWKA
jgi:phage gp45-like